MEGKMGQLMAERSIQIVGIGPKQDGAGAWQRYGSSPRWGPARGQRVEAAQVRHHNQPQSAGSLEPETGPLGRLARPAREIRGKPQLSRPRHGGHLPNPYRHRFVLEYRIGHPEENAENR
jgi:hypothetical protein